MALDADMLIDRKKHKRSVRVWRLLFLLAFAAVLLLAAGIGGEGKLLMKAGLPGKGRDHIARVAVEGTIMEYRPLIELLDDVAEDDNAKALIVEIDSPGGAAVSGEAIYKKLKSINEKKPVVAVMGNMATSAAYMVALGSGHIFAHEATITASIGALFEVPNVKELSQKVGVQMQTVKSGELKAEPSMFDTIQPNAREMLQGMANEVRDMFIGMVAERRGLKEEEVRVFADGRVVSGKHALEAKLVDAIGGEDEAIAWLEEDKKLEKGLPVRDVKIKEDLPKLQELLEGSKAFLRFLGVQGQGRTGMLSEWQNNVIN